MAHHPQRSRSPFAHLNDKRRAEDPQTPLSEEEGKDPKEEKPDDTSTSNNEESPAQTSDEDSSSHEQPLTEEEMDAEDKHDDEDDIKAEKEDEPEDKDIRDDAKARASARCRAIFRRPEAAHNVSLACHLAFNTSLNRQQSIAALRAASNGSQRPRRTRTQADTTASLRSRMNASSVRPVRSDALGPKSSLLERVAAYNRRNS